jgi:hypothetical protein
MRYSHRGGYVLSHWAGETPSEHACRCSAEDAEAIGAEISRLLPKAETGPISVPLKTGMWNSRGGHAERCYAKVGMFFVAVKSVLHAKGNPA